MLNILKHLTENVPVIVSKLRKMMVDEMLQNKHVYENFFQLVMKKKYRSFYKCSTMIRK